MKTRNLMLLGLVPVVAAGAAWSFVDPADSQVAFSSLELPVSASSADADFTPWDLTALQRPEVEDLETLLGRERAETVIASADDVFQYFDFGEIGQRTPNASVPDEISRYAGGQCDLTVAAFRDLSGDGVLNLDFVVPKPSGQLSGHTIAYLPAESGHVLVDTTFGLVFQHHGDLSVREAFRQNAYQVSRMGETAPEYQAAQGDPTHYYDLVGEDRAFFALPGEMLQVVTEVIELQETDSIGAVDGNGADIRVRFGGYHDHLGSLYRPTHQVWQFNGAAGQTYRVSFQLLQATSNPLRLDVALADDQGDITEIIDAALVPNEFDRWDVVFTAPTDRFDLVISTDIAAGRNVDAIEFETMDEASDNGLVAVF